MYGFVEFFRGTVKIQVESASTERFLNLCAAKDIRFRGVRRVSDTEVQLCVTMSGYHKLCTLTGRGFEIKSAEKSGLPFAAFSLRRRVFLVLGMLLVAAFAWGSSLFIWEISVSGNEKVKTTDILTALDELGVGIGTFSLSIDSERLSNEMILKISELSWFAINTHGSRASVLVRERIPKPETEITDEPAEVYAGKGGLIVKMSVLDGTPKRAVGDTVTAGELLVAGESVSLAGKTRTENARAEVWARTWYEKTAEMPIQAWEKRYTGKKKTKTAVILCGKRINLYFNSGISSGSYDKITKMTELSLPGGAVLPITAVRETYAEYERLPCDVPEAGMTETLKAGLLEALRREIKDGEITETRFDTLCENGIVRVTVRAECREQIAVQKKLTASDSFAE